MAGSEEKAEIDERFLPLSGLRLHAALNGKSGGVQIEPKAV
jgi:hypothetical protein